MIPSTKLRTGGNGHNWMYCVCGGLVCRKEEDTRRCKAQSVPAIRAQPQGRNIRHHVNYLRTGAR